MNSTTHFKNIFLIVIATLLFYSVFFTTNSVYATMYHKPTPVQTNEIESSTNYKDEYYKVRTPLNEAYTIYVEGKTKIPTKRFCIRLAKHNTNSNYPITVFVTPDTNGEFSIKINTKQGNKTVPEILNGKGSVIQADESYDTTPGYKAVGTITTGLYHLTIARATTTKDANVASGSYWWNGPLGGGNGYVCKNFLLSVKSSNNPKLIKYDDAISNNTRIQNLYEKKSYHTADFNGSFVRYCDPYLRDMAFVLTNPKTGKVEYLTKENVSYLKRVADNITSECQSDYDKLLKIYEYITNNIYYDRLAYDQRCNQYSNPYRNLYYMNNKINSTNSSNGKVAVVCQGYAALMVSLTRAEGIPARLVYGHHISQPLTTWADKKDSDISNRTHWWTEAYVDGRWIIIDTNSGTSNIWKRSSFTSTGAWYHRGTTSYVYFDPSDEAFSTEYIYNNIYPGATSGKLACRNDEVNKLRAFLNTKYLSLTNGKRLNSNYNSYDLSTWGTGKADNFTTDGYGRVSKILWGNKSLYGKLNLSDFSKLKYLTIYNNKITSLDISGCSSLIYLSASYNRLTTFNGLETPKLATINLQGNKLTVAKFKHGSRSITVQRNIKAGSFGLKYIKSNSKPLTIYANKVNGYKYLGIYSSTGKKLTSKQTYSFVPTSSKYYVKYKKL